MAAPKGNTFAALPGHGGKARFRVPNESDLLDISNLDVYQKGNALVGYLIWLNSPACYEGDFISWMKARTDEGAY